MAPMTPEQLKAKLAEAFKDATGMSPDEFRAAQKEIADNVKKLETVDRQHTRELVHQNMPQSYEKRAAHLIKADPHGGAGLKFGRFVRTLALARKNHESPATVARRQGDNWLADDIEKALSASTFTAGGAITPDEYVAELIPLLRAASVVRRAGAAVLPMRRGTMTIPRQTAAGTAAYVGEGSNITSSEQTFEQVTLTGHKLAALTAVSNDLLRESDPQADQIVRDDLIQVMGLREDLGFLRDDGTANKPKGIRNQVASANVFSRTAASEPSTTAEVNTDLFKMVRLVKSANVPIVRPAWIFTARTESFLMRLRESGLWMYKDEMASGKLLGFPYFVSNQIPENLNVSGAGSNDETEVFFAEMSQCLIGDEMTLELDIFPGGAYHDGSNVISGISADQTVVRTISKHDFLLRQSKGASVLKAVDWA